MLVFVVPLKSSSVSNSWERVSQLFERCIKSICNQTSPNFKVVIACHEIPDIKFSHSSIEYVPVSFDPPRLDVLDDKLRDKLQKVSFGLTFAEKFNPSHTMLVDADDCVSKHLAAFVSQNPQANGWFINQGYEYENGSRLIYRNQSSFHLKCGTSNIIKYSAYKLSEFSGETKEQAYWIGHRNVEKSMKKRNMPIDPLPFSGAIYNVFNGENIYYQKNLSDPNNPRKAHNSDSFFLRSTKRAGKLLASQLLTNSIRDEFGLYPIH
ncbi:MULTISPECIES: glycosyltransferase family 2 protein [Trichocoleus]|uniref:Glycosyltransferase family 2 protein n=1 Tax=Trichocoleus desertorum GB2-A4 TaxID=2933944 RepID=A0ABV0J5X0_9CYAN|nr:glycosyltransferase family 2 protein [Trichocoleus sp. FACHB-46]MBD1863282.1 glycosyltransferase family 2 protein [Trichocoleus sp. FACHB-46]